jgi:putative Holliday junction resolvase
MARILGIDPGTKRCGLAVTDSSESMAFPRPALSYDERFVDHVRAVIEEEVVAEVVIGRPLSLSGNVTASTEFADGLFEQLAAGLAVPVAQCDERLTTTQAQRALHATGATTKGSRDRIDSASAVVLLQHYIDARHGR